MKKELKAIIGGIAFAYAFQLFGILMMWLNKDYRILIDGSMFIPNLNFQIGIVPIAAWVLMGLFKVSWISKWLSITLRILAFTMPFVFIAMITSFIKPILWNSPGYWIINVVVSILLAVTLLKPLLKLTFNNIAN